MNSNTLPYWMAFAHAKGFSNKRKIDFLIEVVHEKITIQEAMEKIGKGDKCGFNFKEKEWEGIANASKEITNYAFLAEDLLDKGIKAFHVMDKNYYPATLKKNLKKDAPILIYAKGNIDLLRKKSVAIVGARKSKDISLEFTDNVAAKAVANDCVVVSGFAKGVDKKALDSALEHKGQSIIVLPQGIGTYTSKVYYPHIMKGDVLVISTYHPKAKWNVGLAMDRNKTIYGLAEDIYAAESDSKGGTWEGVLDGLKRNRKVYVRTPGEKEKNANLLLIEKGATPVDMHGKEIDNYCSPKLPPAKAEETKSQNEIQDKDIVKETLKLLEENRDKGITAQQIADQLSLQEHQTKKLNKILSGSDLIRKVKKGRYNHFFLNKEVPKQSQMF